MDLRHFSSVISCAKLLGYADGVSECRSLPRVGRGLLPSKDVQQRRLAASRRTSTWALSTKYLIALRNLRDLGVEPMSATNLGSRFPAFCLPLFLPLPYAVKDPGAQGKGASLSLSQATCRARSVRSTGPEFGPVLGGEAATRRNLETSVSFLAAARSSRPAKLLGWLLRSTELLPNSP